MIIINTTMINAVYLDQYTIIDESSMINDDFGNFSKPICLSLIWDEGAGPHWCTTALCNRSRRELFSTELTWLTGSYSAFIIMQIQHLSCVAFVILKFLP